MKLVSTYLGNLKFFYREDDKFVGQRIALGKYEEFETDLILKQVKQDSVVVDVGANIGYYTLLLAKTVKRVYAIEPEEETFEILRKNVEANNLENVVLIKAAASDKKGVTNLIKSEDNFGDHKIGLKGKEKVKTIRLDDLLTGEKKIDLIKIDTQGYEEKVIMGAKEIIKKQSPTLFLEYTPNGSKKMLNYLRSIYKWIRTIDYWFYICRKGVTINKKTGYADLWIKKKANIFDEVNCFSKVQIKKVIKAIIGYGKNKNN